MSVEKNLKDKEMTAAEEKARRQQKKAEERCFKTRVDVSKVSMPVIKQWLVDALSELLPDDDVAVEFIYELIAGAENDEPDIGAIREQMNDFLGIEKSRSFCLDLWRLLLDAQQSPEGVPQKLVDERKRKIEADEKARREADSILKQLRPKPSFTKSKQPKAKINFNLKKQDQDQDQKPDTEPLVKPSFEGNRVGKPSRKTNYNRS